MFAYRISFSGLLTARLDTDYYNPEALNAERALGSVETVDLQNAGDVWNFGAYELCNQIEKSKDPDAPVFISISDINEPFIELEQCQRITDKSLDILHIAAVCPGDILVSIAASIGKCGIVPQHNQRGACANQAIAKFRCKIGDNHFALAYFMSKHFKLLLGRQAGGAVQKNLYLHNFLRLPLLKPHPDAQAYIGNKVRQAEALRARAREYERLFVAEVECEVPYVYRRGRFSRVAPRLLNDDLNPGRFDPDRLAVREAIFRSGGVQLNSFASISAQTASPNSNNQDYLGLDGIDSNTIELSFQSVGEAEVSGTSRLLLPGPVISKLRPYLNKVAYIPLSKTGTIGSTELLCVVPEGVHPAYVYGVLKLSSSLRQLNPVATGATHPRITTDDVLELVVPVHDEHERLGASLEFAQDGYSAARALTNTSKALVESLIERKVTEAELIAAYHNPPADRELMERLTVDGLDVSGAAPLFDDLDRLQELLNEANSAGGSDEV